MKEMIDNPKQYWKEDWAAEEERREKARRAAVSNLNSGRMASGTRGRVQDENRRPFSPGRR